MTNSNRIYVGNVPPEANEEALIGIFEQQTGVPPKNVHLNRNYALIDLPDTISQEKAIEMLNGFEIMGSQLLVEPSLSQNRRTRGHTIQISNIPEQYQWDEFVHFVSNFGSFQDCEKGGSKQNTYNAIVTYENQEEAQQALQELNDYQLQPGIFLKADFLMDAGRGRGGPRGVGGRTRPYNNSGMFRSNDFPLRILVLSDMVGAIIGRAGGTIRQITQQSRARVDVHRKENAGSPEKVITIYGTPENCSTACQKIMEIMQQEANTTNRGEIPLKILAHNNLIGRIIGKNGNTIKRIMEQTDTKVAVSSVPLSSNIHDVNSFNLERIITVKGKLENIGKSERMISSKLRQSYENDLAAMASQTYMYPGVHPMTMMSTTCQPGIMQPQRGSPPAPSYGMYGPSPCMPLGYNQSSLPSTFDLQKETVYVYIPNSAVGAIIGTGGSTIRDMISSSGASLKVIQPGKDESVDKQAERKVCISGSSEAQWKAQYMIFKKVGFEGYPGPQEATLKVEMFVPSSQVGRIIGKGGQTVRDLQRVTHALIKFPEDARTQETDETAVHIIGDFYCTQAAQRQIRALVHKSNGFSPPQQQQRQRMSQPTTLQNIPK